MTKKTTIADVCRAAFFKAVSLKRSAGSLTEAKFVAELTKLGVTLIDEAGNLHFDRREMGDNKLSRSMFTAHTDTVHRGSVEGENKYKWFKTKAGVEWVTADGDVLGADDGAGLAILISMMAQKVPGYYIFFRSEECGGLGSSHFAKEFGSLLKEFDRAVAFDRRGYGDVISHQAGGRCCSDAFAEALATALNDQNDSFMYTACDGGVFTDTANLIDDIPECTNVSVAYDSEHTVKESQDMTHLLRLAEAACKLDWEALPTKRDPKLYDEEDWGYGAFGKSRGRGKYLSDNALGWATGFGKGAGSFASHQLDDDEGENVEVSEIDLLQALELAMFDHVYDDLVMLVMGFASGVYEEAAAKLADSDYERYIEKMDTHTVGFLIEIIKDDLRRQIWPNSTNKTDTTSTFSTYEQIRHGVGKEIQESTSTVNVPQPPTQPAAEDVKVKEVKPKAPKLKAAVTQETPKGK